MAVPQFLLDVAETLYCIRLDSPPVVDCRRASIDAHGRWMESALSVISPHDVTRRGTSDASSQTVDASTTIVVPPWPATVGTVAQRRLCVHENTRASFKSGRTHPIL